jgi:hypothetical protein
MACLPFDKGSLRCFDKGSNQIITWNNAINKLSNKRIFPVGGIQHGVSIFGKKPFYVRFEFLKSTALLISPPNLLPTIHLGSNSHYRIQSLSVIRRLVAICTETFTGFD